MLPLFCLLVGLTRPASAAETPTYTAQVGTDFPVMVGVRGEVELPSRLRVGLGVGVLPGGYVDLINTSMTRFDIYSDSVADLIDLALRRSLVAQAQVGYRPWADRGFVFHGGYMFLGLGGDSSDISVFGEAMDPALLDAASGVTGDATVGLSDHLLYGRAGHEWVFDGRWVVGTSVGFAVTVRSRSTVDFTEDVSAPGAQQIRSEVSAFGEDYLDYVFEEWVHLPMVGVWAGYRFGGGR